MAAISSTLLNHASMCATRHPPAFVGLLGVAAARGVGRVGRKRGLLLGYWSIWGRLKNKIIMLNKAVSAHRSYNVIKSIIMYNTRFITAWNIYSTSTYKCIIVNINIFSIFCKGAMASIWIAIATENIIINSNIFMLPAIMSSNCNVSLSIKSTIIYMNIITWRVVI